MDAGAAWKITCSSLDIAALTLRITHGSQVHWAVLRSAVHEAYGGGKIYGCLTEAESRSLKGHTE